MPPAPTRICTLSLHDALPIWRAGDGRPGQPLRAVPGLLIHLVVGAEREDVQEVGTDNQVYQDRKSTRLNSSHTVISYAVFCLKKKKKKKQKNMNQIHNHQHLH